MVLCLFGVVFGFVFIALGVACRRVADAAQAIGVTVWAKSSTVIA